MSRGPVVRFVDGAARTLDEARRMPPRQFLALQLIRVAHALHDAEYVEHVTVPASAGLVEIMVQGTEYGSGVLAVSGDLGTTVWEEIDSMEAAEELLHRAHCCERDRP